ncbi:flagellar biosynthesis protein FliR [Actinoplanes sp. SE50]|uniref:flagellar biosynthetic protein FliR n=1 Tax=unclassified Actinoplanes TaxID=2626549 RepID=UPI00023EDEF4|nr:MULTISPECIES: flagellar biosynthetic protein FliR [unclassified Actinoplanes]AEV88795.1 Flagellar biosynthetic protein fliR [Actinoplanes sp. SE50/110]ATO87201.1 flagellar biosynthesis protein FliR [Actinoplanes sp. SE50]SLM04619.1 Flagellar biosynthetic protein FliR [Actinoplanes sp. SE50/110]
MNYDVPIAQMLAILLGACRTGAWMVICPPFNTRLIPGPVKALLSVGLALPMAPYLTGTLPSLETSALLFSVLMQIFIGVALGFITMLLFAALQAAGDLLDLFGGFTLATAYDPLGFNQSSIFGRFYNLVAMTLLFAGDGHQLILRGFMQSFRTLPLNVSFSPETFSRLLLSGVGEMFVSALQIAGPLVCVLFLADVSLGLLNRVAPALNAFQLGFPVKIFLVVTLAGLAIAALPSVLHTLVERAVTAVIRLSGG